MEEKAMKRAMLTFLAVIFLLPAASFANDFHSWRQDRRYEPVYRDRPWFEPRGRGYWHRHRVRRHDGRGYDYFYHWHRADGYYSWRDDRWHWPWRRFDDYLVEHFEQNG